MLDVDVEKERISLGIKQLQGDPMAAAGEMKKGDVVTCEVIEVKEAGIDVKIVGTDLTAFIKRSELARDRNDQRSDRFQVGQKVDARVTQFDRRTHKVQLSIKALEVAEEKEAIAQYGSSDSGATLGDILGTALKRKGEEAEKTEVSGARPSAIRNPGLAARGSCFGRRRAAAALGRSHSAAMPIATDARRMQSNQTEGAQPCRSMPISSSIAAACGAS